MRALPFVFRWLPLTLILGVALGLRTADLASRPMHADEANQAVKLGELLDTGAYAFDPCDHHGPTLYYLALPVAWLRGETSLATLTETTVRLLPALAGTLGVFLLALLARGLLPSPLASSAPGSATPDRLRQIVPLAAAALLAVSPPAVYYSRYFVQETLLATFTLATFVCAQRWWRHGGLGWALAAGAGVGLMQATKASAPLFLAAGILTALLVRPPRPVSMRLRRDVLLAGLTAVLVAGAFYSSFGSHWTGLRDAVATYTSAAHRATGDSGHEKAWWYYLQFFGWQRAGGLLWHQLAFAALALCGAALVFRRPPDPASGSPLRGLRAAFVYTALVGAMLSLTPYKTPWHVIHLVPGLALLAAGALGLLATPPVVMPGPGDHATAAGLAAARRFRQVTGRIVAGCVFLAVAQTLISQTRLAVFLRPADARNPYAYVHSAPDVAKARPLALAAQARSPGEAIRVIGEEYWPLPWYLRGLRNVGYWNTPPADCDGALVVVSAAQAAAVRARLHGPYRESFLGLRPDVLCVVFTPES